MPGTSVKYQRGSSGGVPSLQEDVGWDWKSVVVIILGLADVITDWLNYGAWANLQPGLLVGPPHTMTLFGLLVFTVAGTFTYGFDVVNTLFKVKGRKHISQDYAGLVQLWLEDVPLACINVFIAPCSWALARVTQLVAVAVAAIICTFKFSKVLFNFCFKGAFCEKPLTSLFVFILSLIGACLVIVCSIAVFIRNLQQLHGSDTYGLDNAYISLPTTYQNHVLVGVGTVVGDESEVVTHVEYTCNRTLDMRKVGNKCPPEFEDARVKSLIFGFEHIQASDAVPYGNVMYDTVLKYTDGRCVRNGELKEPSYLWYCVSDELGLCIDGWERDLCDISDGPAWHEEVTLDCDGTKAVVQRRRR
ncbi:uncharacterized protein LOC144359419 [Saccoglossus kowalevskii]